MSARRFRQFLRPISSGILIVLGALSGQAQTTAYTPYEVITLAGGPLLGSVDGTGAGAAFQRPAGLTIDANGDLYVIDRTPLTVRKITPTGVVTTVTASGAYELGDWLSMKAPGILQFVSGSNNLVRINAETGLFAGGQLGLSLRSVVSRNDTLYGIDGAAVRVAQWSTHLSIYQEQLLAGSPFSTGLVDGMGGNARFSSPRALAIDDQGILYLSEARSVRKITPDGIVTTLAGALAIDYVDAQGTNARFHSLQGLAVDRGGNVYVAENQAHTIRRITAGGEVTTLAGTPYISGGGDGSPVDGTGAAARFYEPFGIAVDQDGNVFVADSITRRIRKLAPPSQAPLFTLQPAAKFGVEGKSVVLEAGATGGPLPTFQWQKNGVDIPGATGRVLRLPQSDGASVSGHYTIIATNNHGSVTSDSATVAIRPALFDAEKYLALNPDVAAAIGDDTHRAELAWLHYYEYGVFEGRALKDIDLRSQLAHDASLADFFHRDPQHALIFWYSLYSEIPGAFDVAGYMARNPDLQPFYQSPKWAWNHYYTYGIDEGRLFSADFIPDEYLELNPDLKAAFGTDRRQAVMHWLYYGQPLRENRLGRVPIGFNVDDYLARYPDLTAAFGGITPTALRNVTVWYHYVQWGVWEGRSDGDFDVHSYLAEYSDLAAAFGDDLSAAALHWYFYGRKEGRRIPARFDAPGYLARYPDLQTIYGPDLYGAWLHYFDWGVNEGRFYDDLFRPLEYLALYPDLAAAFGNDPQAALLHWLYYGAAEGRQGRY